MSIKPSTHEETYFTQLELERRRKGVFENVTNTKVLEREEQKLLHWMRCPKCGQELSTQQYGPVEIDVCPNCRGLWLDANELETILAKESGLLRSFAKILGRR